MYNTLFIITHNHTFTHFRKPKRSKDDLAAMQEVLTKKISTPSNISIINSLTQLSDTRSSIFSSHNIVFTTHLYSLTNPSPPCSVKSGASSRASSAAGPTAPDIKVVCPGGVRKNKGLFDGNSLLTTRKSAPVNQGPPVAGPLHQYFPIYLPLEVRSITVCTPLLETGA